MGKWTIDTDQALKDLTPNQPVHLGRIVNDITGQDVLLVMLVRPEHLTAVRSFAEELLSQAETDNNKNDQ